MFFKIYTAAYLLDSDKTRINCTAAARIPDCLASFMKYVVLGTLVSRTERERERERCRSLDFGLRANSDNA